VMPAWRPFEHLRHVLLLKAKFKVSETAASSQSLIRRESMSSDNPRHVLTPNIPRKEGMKKAI